MSSPLCGHGNIPLMSATVVSLLVFQLPVVLCLKCCVTCVTVRWCVSDVAAGCEQQADAGSVSAVEDQRACALLPAAGCCSVQPQLVSCLPVCQPGRSAGQTSSHHPHRLAEESDQHQPIAAALHQPTKRVRARLHTHTSPQVMLPLMEALHCCLFVFRFLTMDQTRKLVLLLESDPKASSLPLVGL